MRIDVVTIFPDYLAPLELSLLGKARAAGLVTLTTHDLRDFAHDRHRTVDDTPYGGGAGMVMKPEPWGEAIDSLVADSSGQPRLVVPTPSGVPFSQAMAEELARADHLVFACGRYEGIDARVVEYYQDRMQVDEISIGDYVLNGGEVAAMVVIEAVARLVPGFMGNPASLAEESHHTGERGGLLEYPVYTKPPSWRGHDVPDVLFSGHHAEIDRWRHDVARRRTAARRPDLLHPSHAVDLGPTGAPITVATPADAPELWVLQRCCWVSEAQGNDALRIPPLVENLEDVRRGIAEWRTWVIRAEGRLVASVRARLSGTVWEVGRLMVAPDLEGRGIGRRLLVHAESAAPDGATSYELFTGDRSTANLRMYRKAGYRVVAQHDPEPGVVRLEKPRR
ncbi:MAG: tRNA (guanosine(37)-N1)-methyltransferase TrmD [Nocardioidaceae bacterium]